MQFTKMQALGNDFIIINGLEYKIKNYKEIASNLCDRHWGIGGDGLVIILPPEKTNNDFRMRIFNADGSEAEMCGNGIRCFTHYLRENNLSDQKKLRIETKAGIIKPQITDYKFQRSMVRVNMGRPEFAPEKIPAAVSKGTSFLMDYTVSLNQDKNLIINCVSLGNPHSVIFVDNLDSIKLEQWGPQLETKEIFPNRTNVEFVEVKNFHTANMKVWERGSGATLACGTGACGAVVVGIKKGLLVSPVQINLPGGALNISWSGFISDPVFLTGPAETVFTGNYNHRGDNNGNFK